VSADSAYELSKKHEMMLDFKKCPSFIAGIEGLNKQNTEPAAQNLPTGPAYVLPP
jgi:hypothetical protein